MKKALKWTGLIILTPVLLFIILAILLYIPPVQNWAVRQVTSYASDKTGMSISVERVKLVFPLNLGVHGIKIIQPNDSFPQIRDTIADVQTVIADVQLLPLFRKQVEIDALEFSKMKVNTANFIHEARVKGSVGRLYMRSHGIDLGRESLHVNEASLSDTDVSIELSDTVPPDTSKSENFWKISVAKLDIQRTNVTVHMPGDTLQVEARIGSTEASDGYFDLYKGEYKVRKFVWRDGGILYDNNLTARTKGLDYNHIALSDVNIGIDSLYFCSPKLSLSLRNCSFKEKSGIEVTQLAGGFGMDSTRMYLPAIKLRTPESSLDASYVMDINAFDSNNPGIIKLTADGSFGKQDIIRFMGGMPTAFIRQWPNHPLTVKTVLSGNLDRLEFTGLNAKLPTAFNINAKGFAANLTDTDRLRADITLAASTYDINFLTALLPPSALEGVRIPQGIGIKGRFGADGTRYNADFTATEGGGQIKAAANIDTKIMRYAAKLQIRNLQANHFLPGYGIGALTGNVDAKGTGTDIMARSTRLSAKADIKTFRYGTYNLDRINAAATISDGTIHARIDSDNPLLKGLVSVDALSHDKMLKATVSADISHADLYNLHILEKPLSLALCCHLDLATDMNEYYKAAGSIGDITIKSSKRMFRPKDISMDVLTRKDTTHAVIDCGDLSLRMDAGGGYRRLLSINDRMTAQIKKDHEEKRINPAALRKMLPDARIRLTTGKDNFFSKILAYKGYVFDDLAVNLVSSPTDGLNGDIQVIKLVTDSIQLDTIRLSVLSDSTNMTYHAQVRNSKANPQYVFNVLLDGYFLERGLGANVRFYDAGNNLGLRFGAEAMMEDDGIRIRMLDNNPVLGYKVFDVNDDNYLFMGRDRRISAKLNLTADDGQGIQIYSNDDNTEALQDITVSLNRFDLEKVMSVLPYMPKMSGTMNGDINAVLTDDNLTVASSVSVDNMTYENNRMGDLAVEFVYMPKEDGTHYVDGMLMSNGKVAATVDGTYKSEDGGYIDVNMKTARLPISLANGFMPDGLLAFSGYCDGEINIEGTPGKPQVNGELFLDSCYMSSPAYGVSMRFSNDPVRIVGSNLLLENFEMFAYNENPLNIYGNVDFSDLSDINMNVRMRATNFQVIKAKENVASVAYGKAYVNFYGMMKGALDDLSMRGSIDVLGSTDLAYILRDSPLSTDNHLDELVKFTDFNDTTKTVVSRPPITGFDMDLMLNVDDNAHIICYLNTDKSNYVDLMGGGKLRMQYSEANDLRLTGRYTLSNGEMKYSLPVIPLKTFTIQDGSYIEFTGDAMNPRLNITAVERVRASVSSNGSQGRTVDFDCGVIITKTLNDMGLEFTLDAPEDMTLHNELQSMSVEQRGKQAVTMLSTGMYLADGNTSGFSMNGALSSFLQSEINNITGSALRTFDLSFDMGNVTDAGGNTRTDYSFKFAKRFWNNRMNIVVGGKVSSGSEMADQNESFFDNVTLEYRLDKNAQKYVKVFYDNNAYDWLEGYTQEYGVGFIWRRSLQHFRDIFSFKSDKPQVPPASNDTVKTKADDTKNK